jgi:integrase
MSERSALGTVSEWKSRRPRRRGFGSQTLPRERVLSWEERQRVLGAAADLYPRFYPMVLFLAETGCRLGEAIALRWIDMDLEGGWARISRSFSSDSELTTTKPRRERHVSLSGRAQRAL